jgi:hypothetical protein
MPERYRRLSPEDREMMRCGHYLSPSISFKTGKCMCDYCTGRNKLVCRKISNLLRRMVQCIFIDPKI